MTEACHVSKHHAAGEACRYHWLLGDQASLFDSLVPRPPPFFVLICRLLRWVPFSSVWAQTYLRLCPSPTSTWRHTRDEWDQAFPVFHALPLPCTILNANRRTKNGGGLETRLCIWHNRFVDGVHAFIV